MPGRSDISAELAAIRAKIDLATPATVDFVRSEIDRRFGILLVQLSDHDAALVEGARILCYLYLHELEGGRSSSASRRIAENSLEQIGRAGEPRRPA
jgi:hypothetical protein